MLIYIFMTLMLSSVTFLMYYFYSKTLDYKNGEILLIKIPYVNKDDKEVVELAAKSRKMLKIVSVVQLILFVLINFLLYTEIFFIIILMFVLLLPIAIETLYLNAQRKKLLLLKSKKGWNSSTDVLIDTKLLNSGLKSKYNKIFIYSILIFLVFIVLDILFLKTELVVTMIAITPISLILVFFMVMKSESYIYISENYEENYQYNLNKINENIRLFKQMIIVNIVVVFIQILGSYILINKVGLFSNFILAVLLLSFFVMIYYMIKYNQINKKYEINRNSIFDTGDFYDYISYDNPYDSRVFVPEKIQMGMTINRGTPKGKLVFIANYLIAFVMLVGAFYFMILTEEVDYKYTIENSIFEIDSAGYDSEINLKDIVDIEIKEFKEFPESYRSNGVASNKRSYGNWKVEGYGKVRLYEYNEVDYLIILKTKDQTYMLNDNSAEKTKKLYYKIVSEYEAKTGNTIN